MTTPLERSRSVVDCSEPQPGWIHCGPGSSLRRGRIPPQESAVAEHCQGKSVTGGPIGPRFGDNQMVLNRAGKSGGAMRGMRRELLTGAVLLAFVAPSAAQDAGDAKAKAEIRG